MLERNARAEAFLDRIAAAPSDAVPGYRIAVVVAHPDDETIACGALLARLDGATVVLVTDGAPCCPEEARRHGCNSIAAYRALRSREWRRALAVAGIGPERAIALGIADQQAAFALPGLAARLRDILQERQAAVVITHAYEGGHPDHDATAFAAHAAAAALGAAVIEMPFYRQERGRLVAQSFVPSEATRSIETTLLPDQAALKARMLAAYGSQAASLRMFSLDCEHFRRAPGHDFRQLPNGGNVLYDHCRWGLTSQRWLELVAAADAASAQDRRSC